MYRPAILYLDYILTFDMEVERFWQRQFSWVSVGFFLNRYIAVITHIPVMLEFFGSRLPSVSYTMIHATQLHIDLQVSTECTDEGVRNILTVFLKMLRIDHALLTAAKSCYCTTRYLLGSLNSLLEVSRSRCISLSSPLKVRLLQVYRYFAFTPCIIAAE